MPIAYSHSAALNIQKDSVYDLGAIHFEPGKHRNTQPIVALDKELSFRLLGNGARHVPLHDDGRRKPPIKHIERPKVMKIQELTNPLDVGLVTPLFSLRLREVLWRTRY